MHNFIYEYNNPGIWNIIIQLHDPIMQLWTLLFTKYYLKHSVSALLLNREFFIYLLFDLIWPSFTWFTCSGHLCLNSKPHYHLNGRNDYVDCDINFYWGYFYNTFPSSKKKKSFFATILWPLHLICRLRLFLIHPSTVP